MSLGSFEGGGLAEGVSFGVCCQRLNFLLVLHLSQLPKRTVGNVLTSEVPKADSDPCSHRCYRFSQNLPFHVREQQLEDVLKRLHQWSVVTAQCSNPGTLTAAQLSKPGAGITLEPSEEAKPHTKKSLLECWPGFGRSQVAWSSEVFPFRNPCWGGFPWLSQGEGTALEFLQPQAGDASPENQFRIVHLTLSLTCGFQGAFWSSGYSQERIFHHLTFKPGIPNPHRSRGKLVKG
ncbi:uncharacterized protein LOC125324514 isoform X1 [Corvus hawaiiensis]|uniref:uncharacterized protein LOC125324514 isoform X1 n=1 Tax=Corvus hawaiiensis TaxID=134902 RepID=UPI002018694A|nr:uncharacterized protein LOC125324514 isoform X1 [Corvus hawaiiensis]